MSVHERRGRWRPCSPVEEILTPVQANKGMNLLQFLLQTLLQLLQYLLGARCKVTGTAWHEHRERPRKGNATDEER